MTTRGDGSPRASSTGKLVLSVILVVGQLALSVINTFVALAGGMQMEACVPLDDCHPPLAAAAVYISGFGGAAIVVASVVAIAALQLRHMRSWPIAAVGLCLVVLMPLASGLMIWIASGARQ